MRRLLAVTLLFVPILLLAHPSADAADGRLEINQACALAGCFPGDEPGFPVSITTGGSYVLTGELGVLDLDVSAIELQTSQLIAIDLNGFTIHGARECDSGASCSGNVGSGRGITGGEISDPFGCGPDEDPTCTVEVNPSVTIENGLIRNFAGGGVNVTQATIQQLVVEFNGGNGLDVNLGTIRHVTASDNGENGINLGHGSIVDSFSRDNWAVGIWIGKGSVRSSSVEQNGGHGILTFQGPGVVIENCIASRNGSGEGLAADLALGQSSIVRGTLIDSDFGTIPLNCVGGCVIDRVTIRGSGDGIRCLESCTVTNSTLIGGGEMTVGISVGEASTVRGNSIRSYGTGIASSSATATSESNTLADNGRDFDGGTRGGGNFCDGIPCD